MPKIAHNILQAMIAASIGIGVLFLIIATSQDVQSAGEFGTAWTEQGTNALPVAVSGHTTVSFDDRLWVIGGDNGGTATRKVYSSPDGITWTEAGTDALPAARTNHCSVAGTGSFPFMLAIGGLDSAGAVVDTVYFSDDGITWLTAAAFPAPRSNMSCIERSSGVFLAAGGDNGGSTTYSNIYVGFASGLAWSDLGIEFPVIGPSNATRTNGVMLKNTVGTVTTAYYIGGEDPIGTAQDDVFSSTNVTDWTITGSLDAPARSKAGGVTAGSKMLSFGGLDYTVPVTSSGSNDVFSAVQGNDWVPLYQDVLPVEISDFGYTMFKGRAWITGGIVEGVQVQTVYATDDVAGFLTPSVGGEDLSDIGADVNFTSQSGDTANNQLPFMDMVQNAETSTGYPLVTYTIYMIFLMLAMALMFYLARQAPDNHWIAAIGVIVLCVIGFALGREAIDWYILIAVTAFVTGVASIAGKVSA